jgi:ribosomal protein S18 acetylase RimI-like enzyme
MMLRFTRIEESEFDQMYKIICDATGWLNEKGIRQWDRPIPEGIMRRRVAAQAVYGLWDEDSLVCVVSLLARYPAGWEQIPEEEFHFIATMALDPAYRHKGLGKTCLEMGIAQLVEGGEEHIYLDCVDNQDVLPLYYEQAGFSRVAVRTGPDGKKWELMKYKMEPK